MLNTIKSQIQKKLKILNSRVLSNNKLPLSVIQYDATDIVNCLDTLTRGWPTIGKEVANRLLNVICTKENGVVCPKTL